MFFSNPFAGARQEGEVNVRASAIEILQSLILFFPVIYGAQEFGNSAGAAHGAVGAGCADELVDS
jgi:hypothetical protein